MYIWTFGFAMFIQLLCNMLYEKEVNNKVITCLNKLEDPSFANGRTDTHALNID